MDAALATLELENVKRVLVTYARHHPSITTAWAFLRACPTLHKLTSDQNPHQFLNGQSGVCFFQLLLVNIHDISVFFMGIEWPRFQYDWLLATEIFFARIQTGKRNSMHALRVLKMLHLCSFKENRTSSYPLINLVSRFFFFSFNNIIHKTVPF